MMGRALLPSSQQTGTFDGGHVMGTDFTASYIFQRDTSYSTLPIRKTHHILNDVPERSVTPDITRDLGHRKYGTTGRPRSQDAYSEVKEQHLRQYQLYRDDASDCIQVPSSKTNSPKISPIDPKSSSNFKCSTPKVQDLKAAINLESRLLSPKKSTMTNEELYTAIHKSKKKLNISDEEIDRASPVEFNIPSKPTHKTPETGYLGDKSKTRLSWSPGTEELNDFTDKFSNEAGSRQSWACKDRKGSPQTSRLDFKKLLLQHSKPNVPNKNNKLSAVEQLKMSKQQIQNTMKYQQDDMNILELSRSPRNIGNRKFNTLNSPRNAQDKPRSVPKLLSPRSQWRFPSPRSDVLSSTIPEDCREDESPNSSGERKSKLNEGRSIKSVVQNLFDTTKPVDSYKNFTERTQAQRAQFFGTPSTSDYSYRNRKTPEKSVLPTLETAF